MKKKFMTRTQLAKHLGITIGTLKDHLIHHDILDASGKSPSVRAILEGFVEWRLLHSDNTQRFFVMDVGACEMVFHDLVSSRDVRPPFVSDKNSAMKVLVQAGDELLEALNPERANEEEDCGTDEIGWLSYGCRIGFMTAYGAEDRKLLAVQIESRLEAIRHDIDTGLIQKDHPNTEPALTKIQTVMQWCRGGKPNAVASPRGEMPEPSHFEGHSGKRILKPIQTNGKVREVQIQASKDEIFLLRAGHTLRRDGEATGPLLEAFAQACAMMHEEWQGDQKVNYGRISVDGQRMLFSDWTADVEIGRKQLVSAFDVKISDSAIAISKAASEHGDEILSIGINAADGHFGPERVQSKLS